MRRFWNPYTVIIAVILFLTSIPLQFRATSSPQFCESCHEMTPMVASFKTSTHTAMGCMGCHTTPGQINFVKDKLRDGSKDIFYHFMGYKGPYKADVPNSRCLVCHGTIVKRNVFRLLEVDHDRHLALGVPCIKCHLKVGHQTFTLASDIKDRPVAFSFERTHRKVTRDTCFSAGCHDGKAAKMSCATCHKEQQRVKPMSHRPGFLFEHGRLAETQPKNCLTCHKAESPLIAPDIGPTSRASAAGPNDDGSAFQAMEAIVSMPSRPRSAGVELAAWNVDYGPHAADLKDLLRSPFCQSCHTKLNPHPAGWVKAHGGSAKANQPQCAVCHTDYKKDCMSCHKLPMPHPAGFLQAHPTLARTSLATCLQCHDRKLDCDGCHRSTKPASHTAGFIHKHKTPALSSPESCMNCHQKRECEGCHQTVKPVSHTAAWVSTHGSIARSSPQSCMTCHKQLDCTGCHHSTRPASHTPNFRAIHGKLSMAHAQDCLMCHRQTTCNACHQLPMPHPKNYQATHIADAKRSLVVCANCHKKPDCLKCHDDGDFQFPKAELDLPGGPHYASRDSSRGALLALMADWPNRGARCPVTGMTGMTAKAP